MDLPFPATSAKIAPEYGTNLSTMAAQVRMKWLSTGFGLLWVALVAGGGFLCGRAFLQHLELTQSEADFVVALEQYRSALVRCEREVGALTMADTPTGRLAGYEPTSLQRALHHSLCEAHQAYQKLQTHLEAFLPKSEEQPQLAWLTSRLQIEWGQLQALMEQFLQGKTAKPPNPALIRWFQGSSQSSPYHTLENLKRVFTSRLHIKQQATLNQAMLYGGLLGIGLVLGLAWLWWRWIHSARRLQRFITQLALPIPTPHNEWHYAQQSLEYFRERLRSAEAFMRDLAMGRIPEPIPPENENDPLARSSRWLLRRFEQLRDAERTRQAV